MSISIDNGSFYDGTDQKDYHIGQDNSLQAGLLLHF